MGLSYELTEHHLVQIHELYQNEWWTKGRTYEETVKCVKGSQVCLVITNENDGVEAFARVITDFTFKALIFDVIVSSEFRGGGKGNEIMKAIKSHPLLSTVKSFELYCLPELEGFYRDHGFTTDVGGIKLMRLQNA